MDTLSYEEFLEAVGKRELYNEISLYGEGNPEDYDELKHWYDIYLAIGGYPAIVKCYLETRDIEKYRMEMGNIIRIFIDESERYFHDILEVNRYFLRMTGADQRTTEGIANENFVYLYLDRLVKRQKIAGTAPAFGVYKQGEIDFFVRGLDAYMDYAIEVKAGKNIGKTANAILQDGKADFV